MVTKEDDIDKLSNRDANWLANYEELKAHVLEAGHFFNKHSRGNNWVKYQRKRIKAGTMPEVQRVMLEALEKMRSGAHTVGNTIKQKDFFKHLSA